jgi:choline dehydrogenase
MKRSDYVVVGAGSAGCVLADRLSAAGHSVVVLEAGGSDDDMLVKIPALYAGLFQGPNNWNYTSEPEPVLFDRRLFLPRGGMLGGCSSMNALIYMRGAREDYDGWVRDFGATGWSYDEALPYFVRSETNADIHDRFHGTGGTCRSRRNVGCPRTRSRSSSRRWRPGSSGTRTSTVRSRPVRGCSR